MLAAICWMVAACGCARDSESGAMRWRLVYEETFDKPLPGRDVAWVRDEHGDDSPWHVSPFDDDGEYFQVLGGVDFRRQLASFHTYRKRYPLGRDGWLTVELAARDRDKDGKPETPPSFTQATLPGGRTIGHIVEPDHHGGVIIRNTRALPKRYRIEMTLVTLNFGGSRYEQWNYDGLINGYLPGGAKTRHPWPWGGSEEFGRPYDKWYDVRGDNGFYYLAIMDYPNPAPHNNVLMHLHRKVVMDSYHVPDKRAYFETCNPANGRYFISHDNSVNMLFFEPLHPKNGPGKGKTGAMVETECGVAYGGEAGRRSVIAAVQLVPELMPKQTYRFAIERDATGYTMEIRGHFRFVGHQTYRYRRDFVQDGRAIWHYNQTPDEYDGSFDATWTLRGPFGRHVIEHVWPAESAYPDYFIIGDPHTNYYEGTASIDDLRLYVPAD